MMKKIILMIICLISTHAGISQDKKIWTLRECIDYALQNNLNVKRSLLSVENTQIGLTQSKLQMLPSLNGGSTFGYNWGRSIDPTTNLFSTQRINSFNLNASSSVILFNGFRLMNTYRQSDLDNAASKEDFAKSKNDVILSVITFYTNVIFNKELFSNAESQLATTTQQLERTRRLAEAGSVPRGNVLDLEAQQATNELNLINRENALNLSLLQLKQALQFSASTPMEIEVPQIDIGTELLLTETSEQIYEAARQTLPEVKSAQLKLQSSVLALKASRGSLYPRLSLNGNLFSNYSSAADRDRFIRDGGTPTTVAQQIGYLQGANTPVLTDVHDIPEVAEVASVVDVLQTPAFLCRQTDFIHAVASAGLPVNIKKGQFLAPGDMKNVVDKAREASGRDNIMVCERGASFGYNNLISDMRSLAIMRETGCPVVFDATHSVQLPGGQGTSSGGQRDFVPVLARAAVASGIAGIFMETHPDPSKALSDGPNAWPLGLMADLLGTLKELDALVKRRGFAETGLMQ